MLPKKIKLVLKEFIPPIILKAYRRRDKRYGFFGNYSSWEDAIKDSVGYDSDVILNKVRDSLLKVKAGEAVYERDSVLFDEIQYSFPVLAGLLRVASDNDNKLSVLDFGGSLGSHFYQNKQFLSTLDELQWSIVEQENFVRCGKQLFENDRLKFYSDIDTCLQHEQPDVILLSCVIQYLKSPYKFLENIVNRNFKHIILDKIAFRKGGGDCLTVQKVPPHIYHASYPAWFFDENKFLNYFRNKYELIAEFDSNITVNIQSQFKGFIFKCALKYDR